MPLDYTKRVEIMQSLLKKLGVDADDTTNELSKKLSNLRKYSDVAQLIGYPKNQRMGVFTEATTNVERAKFNQFKTDLVDAEDELVALLRDRTGKDYTNPLRRVLQGDAEPSTLENPGPKLAR